MLTPTDALGAAAVQLVTFLREFISVISQIRKNGCTFDEKHLRGNTLKLAAWNTDLRSRARFLSKGDDRLNKIVEASDAEIEKRCTICDELIKLLTKSSKPENRFLASIWRAIHVYRNKTALAQMVKLLKECPQTLSSLMPSMQNKKSEEDA